MRVYGRYGARFVSVAVFAILGAGCDTPDSKPSAGVPNEGTLQQYQQYPAVQATKDYAYALRAEFVKDMQDELAAINRTVQQLSDKVESGTGAAKTEARAKLVVVRDRVAELNAQLERARSTPEAAWAEVRDGFKKSQDDVKESVAQARTWLSEKIAP